MKIGTAASKKKKLELKLHSVIRQICLQRHPFCVVCGNSGEDVILQGGHLIPAGSSKSVRFDLMNVFTQCKSCNGLHRYNQSRFIHWFVNEYGLEEYNDLVERSKATKNWKTWELEELIEEYKSVLDSSEIIVDYKKQ